MAHPFEYKALKASEKEIRLILILSREFSRSNGRGDELICGLEPVPLDLAKGSYAALSYTWGAPGITKQIAVLQDDSEAILTIQENLYDALCTFRLDDLNRFVWADAICINQSDNSEKSSQVQLMGEVYQYAEATFVWLGNATAESDLAFDFMHKFANEVDATEWEWESLLASVNTEDDANATFPCDAMTDILWRPWFSRIWVVQEVALASRAFFYCGEKSIEDFDLFICAHLFALVKDSLSRKEEQTEYEKRLIRSVDYGTGRPMPIMHQLPCYSSRPAGSFLKWFEDCQISNRGNDLALKATDPRDLIFGLIGIASDAEGAGIKADYTKSLIETFVDVTKALLLKGDLGILGFAQHPRESTDLPSWVPDWRRIPFRPPLLYTGMDPGKMSSLISIKGTPWEHADYRSFSISPETSASIVFTNSDTCGTILTLDAFVLSTVSGLATTNMDPEGIAYTNITDWVVQLMAFIKRSDSNIYPTEEAQKDAVFRTLVTDRLMLPTAGRSSCRTSSSHYKPMQDIVAELAKPDPDDDVVADAHIINTTPGTDMYYVSIRNMQLKTPFVTHGGWIGLGPESLQKGDTIVVPLGGQLPLALRPDGTGKYRFVGEAYVHGIMDGEIMKMGLPVVKIDIY